MVLLLLIIVIPLIFIADLKTHKKMPVAKNGVLDLSNWDFEKDGATRLNGEWGFYWKQLLTYDDFHEGQNKFNGQVNVPNVWNYYTIDGKELPGEGYATYRLKVKTNDQEILKGLKILNLSTSYKIMINDEVVAANGVVGKNKDTTVPEYRSQAVTFKNDSNEFEVIVQLSNFTYSRGGIWYSIYLGTDQQIRIISFWSAYDYGNISYGYLLDSKKK